VLIDTVSFSDQCLLQDDFSLFVALTVVHGKLIHPAYFVVTVLTENISDPMPASQHDALRTLTVVQVDDFVEEKCSSCGACEPGGNEFAPVGQKCLAVHATEHAASAHMGQVMTTHDCNQSILLSSADVVAEAARPYRQPLTRQSNP